MENYPLPAPDSVPSGSDFQSIMETLGSTFGQAAAHQAEAARHTADANLKIATLQAERDRLAAQHQHSNDRLSTHYGFTLRLLGGLAIGGVIIGGFMVGRFELVTHALAGVGGLFAGYGLARASR